MSGNGLLLRGMNRAGGLPLAGFNNAATGTPPTPVTQGSISLVSVTATTISLSATEATGGTPPITHQWSRSTSLNGTYTDVGTNSLSLGLTGLASGTTYYFRLTYTDSIGQTAVATFSVATSVSSSELVPLLYEPLTLSLVNATGQDFFSLADGISNQTMQVRISDGNSGADWRTSDYGIAQVDVALVSINEPQVTSNSAVLKEACAITETAASGVTVNVVFSPANILDLTGILYYAYATVLFSSGQIEIFGAQGSWRVERN